MVDKNISISSEKDGEHESVSRGIEDTITDRIEEILQYEITNTYLKKFINEFGHLDQLVGTPNEITLRLHKARIYHWEKLFTDSFYRAAIIVAQRKKTQYPTMKGINMESVILEASELLEKEHEDMASVWGDIGYRE